MAKRTIITDIEKLHRVSDTVDCNASDTNDLLLELYNTLPENQLGLAAPQIDVTKRVFVAWLPVMNRRLGFVNPTITKMNDSKTPSTEGCLSLPGVERTVERCANVSIEADRVVEFSSGADENIAMKNVQGPLELVGLESFIVQHETDHLDGVLLIDHTAVQSLDEKLQEREKKRQAKIQARRAARKAAKQSSQTNVGAKKQKTKKELEKEKKRARKQRKRQQRSLEIAERYKAEQEGLFDPTA